MDLKIIRGSHKKMLVAFKFFSSKRGFATGVNNQFYFIPSAPKFVREWDVPIWD